MELFILSFEYWLNLGLNLDGDDDILVISFILFFDVIGVELVKGNNWLVIVVVMMEYFEVLVLCFLVVVIGNVCVEWGFF